MAEDWRKLFFTPKKKHINDLLLLFRSALILKPKKLRVKPLLRLVSTAYKLKFKQRYLSNAEREGFEPLLQCVLCQSHRKTNSRNSWITPKWCYQKAVAGFCTLKLQFSFVFQKLLGLHSLGVPVICLTLHPQCVSKRCWPPLQPLDYRRVINMGFLKSCIITQKIISAFSRLAHS